MVTRRLALLALALTAVPGRLRSEGEVPKVPHEKYVLENGLQVILHVDRKLPIVHVNQWFHVGSKNEKPGRTGFAHLFEHMMFQGSKNSPGKYLSDAEKIGASLRTGGVNGTTDTDRTNYFITAPSGALELLLWLESDRLTGLLDAMTQVKLDNQRDVVKNERRQSLENVPYGRIEEIMFEKLFPAGHPYSWTVIGSMEDLTAASMDDVKEFFKTYYTPNNLTLTIAGDFDPENAKALVKKYFGPVPPGPALARPARMPISLTEDRLVTVSDRVPQAKTYILWPAPAYFETGEPDLDIAARILADGLSSRLKKVLVYDKQVCSTVEASLYSMEIAGIFDIEATARPGESLEPIEAAIHQELARLGKSGPTPEELDRAKNKLEYAFVSGLERIGGFGGKADQLARYNTFRGRPDLFEEDLKRYRDVNADGIRTVVQKYLVESHHLTARFYPEVSERSKDPEVDRSRRPGTGTDRPFEVPEVHSGTLPGGLTLLVASKKELPKVVVQFTARGGSSKDPKDRPGLSQMLLATIDKGTKTHKALQIEDSLANLGAQLDRAGGVESSSLRLSVLKRNLEKAMVIFADILLNPSFPREELEREVKKARDDLSQAQQDGPRTGQRIAPMLLFGREHPYGHSSLGTEESLKAMTPEDLETYYKTYFTAPNSALIFTGDVDQKEVEGLAGRLFSSISKDKAPERTVPPPEPVEPGKVYFVDRPDAAQSVIYLAFPGMPRSHPQYYDLSLADAVWGGSFGARLNLNLREDKGYSYGVFTSVNPFFKEGAWQGGGSFATKVTKESLAELFKEVENIAGKKPITDPELEGARTNRIRSYAQTFESLSQLTGKLGSIFALERPLSDLTEEPVALSKVTRSQAQAAARSFADPRKLRVIVVGDRAKVLDGLKSLKPGAIVFLDPMGNPVK